MEEGMEEKIPIDHAEIKKFQDALQNCEALRNSQKKYKAVFEEIKRLLGEDTTDPNRLWAL